MVAGDPEGQSILLTCLENSSSTYNAKKRAVTAWPFRLQGFSPGKREVFFSFSSFPFERAQGRDRNQLPRRPTDGAVPAPGRGGRPRPSPKPRAPARAASHVIVGFR